MENTSHLTVQFLGIEFDLTILAMCLLTVFVVFGLVFWASRQMKVRPSGKQNVLESVFDFVQNTTKSSLGNYNNNYRLLFFSFFTFILFANNVGLMAKIVIKDYSLWTSPTATFMVAFGLALIVAGVCHVEGIRKKGFKGYLKEYAEPIPGLLPMNILEEFTNILSLAMRLFGNIYAGEIVVGLLASGLAHINIFGGVVAFVVNVLWTAFSVFISCIQAYVFIILSSNYLGKKVNGEGE